MSAQGVRIDILTPWYAQGARYEIPTELEMNIHIYGNSILTPWSAALTITVLQSRTSSLFSINNLSSAYYLKYINTNIIVINYLQQTIKCTDKKNLFFIHVEFLKSVLETNQIQDGDFYRVSVVTNK